MAEVLGHISQIIGPVVDVHFEHSEKEQNANLPSIHDALKIQRPGSNTSEKTRGAPSPWIVRTACNAA